MVTHREDGAVAPPVPRAPHDHRITRSTFGSVTVLEPYGVLTRALGHELRLAVETEFAFSARPLVCDLSAVPAIDVEAVGLLHAASENCGGWPLVHLAVCAARPDVARRLRRSGASRFLVVRDTLAQAERDVLCRPPKLRARQDLAPGLAAMVAARRFVADCCLRWRLPELMGTAADATARVLRLAALHGQGPMRLTVDSDGERLFLTLHLRILRPPVDPSAGPHDVRVEAVGDTLRLSAVVGDAQPGPP